MYHKLERWLYLMKKKLFVIFLSMVFVLSLFGCGGRKGYHYDYIKPSDFKENIEENVIYTFKKGNRTYYYKNVEREDGQIKFNQNSAFWILNDSVMVFNIYGEQLTSYTFSIDPLDQFKTENSCKEDKENDRYQCITNSVHCKTDGYSYSLENTSESSVLVEEISVGYV